mgnify:CR=1 FL=1
MIIGNYSASVSSGVRVAVPRIFRQKMGMKLVAAKWYEGCVVLISEDSWGELVKRVLGSQTSLTQAVRDTDRFLLGSAHEVQLDSQGRFVVPESLREFAKISDEVVFLGLGDRVELWDKKAWDAREAQIAASAAELVERNNG